MKTKKNRKIAEETPGRNPSSAECGAVGPEALVKMLSAQTARLLEVVTGMEGLMAQTHDRTLNDMGAGRIKRELYLDQIRALTDEEFEDLINRVKQRIKKAVHCNTTPVVNGKQIFGREVTEGELAAQRALREVISEAGRLRKIRAQGRRSF